MNNLRKMGGFTLIELLIVIVILGVLAASLVVAINPMERIAQAKDSKKKTTVSQLVSALESYSVMNGGHYPSIGNDWITRLVNSGELKNVPSPISNIACTPSTNNQNNYCYELSDDGNNAIVYVALETSYRPDGTAGTTPYYLWSSEAGASGIYYSISGDIDITSDITFDQESTLSQGLVGWWKMNGDATDSSNNGNNGTVYGATLTFDKNGQPNKAYRFDGIDDYIGITDNITALNTDFSIGIWIKPADAGTNSRFFTLMDTNNGRDVQVGVMSADKLYIRTNNSTTQTNNTIAYDSWIHIVWTYKASDGSKKTYADGALWNSAIGGITADGIYSAIGGGYTNSYLARGTIDDVRIYNRALSTDEIINLFNAGPQ